MNTDAGVSAADPHDRAINHIFRSGLTLATMLDASRVDDEHADRLRDVVDDLNAAVVQLRHAALARVVRGAHAERDALPHATTRREAPGSVTHARAIQVARRRRLCRFDDCEVFAYALTGHDYFRAADDTLWAHESDGMLLSARSGSPLARRVRNAFYDIESNVPLYYELAE